MLVKLTGPQWAEVIELLETDGGGPKIFVANEIERYLTASHGAAWDLNPKYLNLWPLQMFAQTGSVSLLIDAAERAGRDLHVSLWPL